MGLRIAVLCLNFITGNKPQSMYSLFEVIINLISL